MHREQGQRAPSMGPKRVLVTGANGFMGSHMVEWLLANGDTVVATDMQPDPSPVFAGRADYVRGDLRDPASVASLIVGKGPFRQVFHVAGLFDYGASYQELFEANAQGTYNLLYPLIYDRGRGRFKSQAEMPEGVVVWGAAGVYDFRKESPAKETSPLRPTGGYLTTKFFAEQIALEMGRLGLPVTIVRPAGVYGPRSRYGVATSIFIAARGGLGPLYFGSGRARGGTVHAADVCGAAAFLCGRPDAAGEAFNVGDESTYTNFETSLVIARRLGFPMIPVALPGAIMKFFSGNMERKAKKRGRIPVVNAEMTALLEMDALLDVSKLRALGWRPAYPDAKQGLLATIDWYEKEGWL